MDNLSGDRINSNRKNYTISLLMSLILVGCGGSGSSGVGGDTSNEINSPEGIYDLSCHLTEDVDDDNCQSVRNSMTDDVALELVDVVASIEEDEESLFPSYTDGPEATFILYSDNSVSWESRGLIDDGVIYEDTVWESYIADREIDGVSVGVSEVYLVETPDSLDYNDGIILSKYNGRVVLGTLILSNE